MDRDVASAADAQTQQLAFATTSEDVDVTGQIASSDALAADSVQVNAWEDASTVSRDHESHLVSAGHTCSTVLGSFASGCLRHAEAD